MIEYQFWLTFSNNGGNKGPVPRITKGEPQTSRGERAVYCVAKLPKSLFRIPSVSINIDVKQEEQSNITAQVEAAAEAFKNSIGIDVDLSIIPSDQ